MIEFNKCKGADHINVEIASKLAGHLLIVDGVWRFEYPHRYDYLIESEELRQIADKLDELNGVSDE